MLIQLITRLGALVVSLYQSLARVISFLIAVVKTALTQPLKTKQMLQCMKNIGVESSTIVILTGSFTGLALALQSYVGFKRFGAENLLGALVALAMIRELGPVLTGLMVTGRAGSAMAAELSTMRITEQIDALITLGIDPYRYLIVPRILASIIIMPCLTLFSMVCGIMGGYIFYAYILELNPETYIVGIRQFITVGDILGGLIKSSFFGLIFSWISTYYGYTARGGARGVGQATTCSVVGGSIIILICNYFLSALLFKTGLS